jgi:hypothetical protein
MTLVHRKQHLFTLVLLAFLSLVMDSLLLLGTVAHVDLWHLFNAGQVYMYPH